MIHKSLHAFLSDVQLNGSVDITTALEAMELNPDIIKKLKCTKYTISTVMKNIMRALCNINFRR